MDNGRTFRVEVYEGGDEPKVEVTVPLKLAKWAISLMPAVKGEIRKHSDIDVEALRGLLDEGFAELESMEPMDIVKVKDGDTRVRIAIT
jgi:hypothetical protein